VSASVLRFVPYLSGVVAIWLVSSMERPPIPESLRFWNSDKLMHALVYAGLAALALFAVRARRHEALTAFLMAAVYGGVDELHQSFVPSRSPSALDVVADTLGALAYVTAFGAVRRWRARVPRSS
jgi:VanZ family protein